MAKTCKDCIHHDVCKRIDYELEYHNKSTKEAEEELPIKCDSFDDKELFLELPCKVGDDVYWLKRSPETYDWYIYQGNIYSICAFNNTSFFYISPICFFDETDLGKTIFFTREAAEQALKEREKNG